MFSKQCHVQASKWGDFEYKYQTMNKFCFQVVYAGAYQSVGTQKKSSLFFRGEF